MIQANVSHNDYRHCVQRAKHAICSCDPNGAPIYKHRIMTFDFAQNATIPQHAREVGALYFKVPRRIQNFRIAAEAVPIPVNYLFDEHQSIGADDSKFHESKAVVSMLHHHQEHDSRQSRSLGLHADNWCEKKKRSERQLPIRLGEPQWAQR